MESCTEFVLVKTPKQSKKVEQAEPDEVATLRKKFEEKLLETKRKVEMEQFEKLRSQSTSLIRTYCTVVSEAEQTHRKPAFNLPSLNDTNQDDLIRTMKAKLGTVLSSLPTKPRNKNIETLLPVALPKPIYDVLSGLKVKPPEPKDKFYQLMDTPPFNRGKNEEFIVHFLKDYKFLRIHPEDILKQISSKVTFEKAAPLPTRSLWIVEHGVLTVEGVKRKQGEFANPQILESGMYEFTGSYTCSVDCRLMAIPKYDYQSFLALHISEHAEEFTTILRQSPQLKMLPFATIEKMTASLTCRFINAGDFVYTVGDRVDGVFIVVSGQAFRKVIVEIDESNRIPVSHKESLLKTYSKSYEYKIVFEAGEAFGYNEVINNEEVRLDALQAETDCMFLCVGANAFRDVLDEHTMEVLREEHNKKYPASYDKLCAKFAQQKQSFRRMELIKVQALQEGCRFGSSDEVQKVACATITEKQALQSLYKQVYAKDQ